MKHQLAALGVVAVALALALLALPEPAAAAGLKISGNDVKSEESIRRLYDRWARRYNIARTPADRLRRFAVFNQTAHRVFSRRVAGGEAPALNVFADTSDQEFNRHYMCRLTMEPPTTSSSPPPVKEGRRGDGSLPLPESFDWRSKICEGQPCLGPVKDQGPSCGTCWAFAATGAMESNRAIRGNYYDDMLLLSQQELLDCDRRSERCAGGNAYYAFRYVMDHGLATATSYRYRGVNDTCHARFTPRANFILREIQIVPRADIFDEASLLSAVLDGPVVVSIAVGNESHNNFRDYHGGVYPAECGPNVTHQVLLVGYNTQNTGYYILKNSWGRGWGEEGYLLLPRDLNCGILNYSSYYPVMA